jgi:hypothetical protein
MRLIVCALLSAGLLAGCGGDDDEPTARKTPVATQAPADAEKDVREVFADYNEALGERDFDDACEALAPETTAKLRENVTQLGITDPPKDCPPLMQTIYEKIDKEPEQKKLIDEIARTATVDTVTVTGDTAKVAWNATVNGRKTPVTQSARRIDGEWKLIDVTN